MFEASSRVDGIVTMTAEGHPVVESRWADAEDCAIVRIVCPFGCGSHGHGFGAGHRIPHCNPHRRGLPPWWEDGYVLVMPAGPPPDHTLVSVARWAALTDADPAELAADCGLPPETVPRIRDLHSALQAAVLKRRARRRLRLIDGAR